MNILLSEKKIEDQESCIREFGQQKRNNKKIDLNYINNYIKSKRSKYFN